MINVSRNMLPRGFKRITIPSHNHIEESHMASQRQIYSEH